MVKRLMIWLISVSFVVGLIVALSIWMKERGCNIDKKVTVNFNGSVAKGALVEVVRSEFKWHWFYDTAIVGSEMADKLLERSKARYSYYVTDEKGRFDLREHAVWIETYVYIGAKKFRSFASMLTPLSTLPRSIDVAESDYVAPAFFYRSSYGLIHDPVLERSPVESKEGNNVVVYAGDNSSDQLKRAYFNELSKSYDVLYVQVVSDNNETALVDGIPYEIHFHDTGTIFLRFVTIVDSRQDGESAYILVYVPKGHTYDIAFFPELSEWPGLYGRGRQVAKPLRPLEIRNVRAVCNPKKPSMKVVLERNVSYERNWENNEFRLHKGWIPHQSAPVESKDTVRSQPDLFSFWFSMIE